MQNVAICVCCITKLQDVLRHTIKTLMDAVNICQIFSKIRPFGSVMLKRPFGGLALLDPLETYTVS